MGLEIILGSLVAALAAVIAAFQQGKRKGRKEAEHDMQKQTLDRVERGREIVRDNRGRSPADRLRQNDGEW